MIEVVEYKKHDPVYWYWVMNGVTTKRYGYVQKKIRDVYVIIDNEGKEWIMYPEEIRESNKYTFKV